MSQAGLTNLMGYIALAPMFEYGSNLRQVRPRRADGDPPFREFRELAESRSQTFS